MTLTIRPEEPADREASLEIERVAFDSDVQSAIVLAVRDREGAFALVAEEDGEVVAHVQFSRAWIGETAVAALGPVGVRPNRQGGWIGSALIRAGIDEARSRGEVAVILLGSQRFYPRFGFEPASMLGLRNTFAGIQPDGFEIAEEDFMLVRLPEGGDLRGDVRWDPAFGQAG